MSNKSVYLLQNSSGNRVLMRDLLDRLFRQKRWILVAVLAWTFAMGLYLWFTPAAYEADIQFLVNNNRAGAVVSSELNNGPVARDYVDESVVATEIQLLSNRELLRTVVRSANLADGQDDVAVERALKKFQKELKVSPVLKANMIKATYSASDPRQVQAVLANLADAYLSEHVRAHSSSGAFDVFDKQAAAYAARLKELQDRLTAFHEGSSIVVLAQQKDINLHKLMDLEAGLKETQAARVANGQKIALLREQLKGLKARITTQARVVPNQYSVERLNTMLAELNNRRTELLVKFQPQDRLVQEVEKQIADTKAALDRSNALVSTEETTDVNPLRQSLEADLAKAEVTDTETRAHEASLAAEIGGYRQALSGLNQATTTDDQLLREIKETEDNYFLYSKKREEARIEEAMDRQRIANVTLVQPPVAPALAQPKISLTVVSTWVLGCLLILGCAFGRGMARASVYTPWELEGITGLPVLASIPHHALSSRARALIAASILELEHE
jgi:uncharacterized protein involved in exopolysaccharide biosynthesis